MEITKYGKTEEASSVEEIARCRQIAQEILNFGVTQRQILKITYLLALELENREDMLRLSSCAQQILDGEQQENSEILS